MTSDAKHENTLFGHPTGLFTLFFAEMWERFSYYGMRALLIFYMIKGFLGYNDSKAYAVYGAYTALVYMTPYFGGMLADRLLGARRAVVLGGLLMAAGHLLMGYETGWAFFGALGLLIVGNGFFKPNISTIVGRLYPKTSTKKDGGFTIFYMGINLGAAMSPVLCGYVGETFGWHFGFGLATIGMLVGVAVFVAPTRLTQAMILLGALSAAGSMLFLQDTLLQLAVRIFLGLALASAGVVAFVALNRGGLPDDAGRAPNPELLKKKVGGILRADVTVYLGSLIAVVLFAFVVQQGGIAKWILIATGVLAVGYIIYEAVVRCTTIERDRLIVVLVLMFFSMLFWAFFEQAGSSVNNFTDRNIDRVFETRKVTEAEVGQTITFRLPQQTNDAALVDLPALSQEQLGMTNADPAMKERVVTAARAQTVERAKKKGEEIKPEDLDKMAEAIKGHAALTLTGLSALRDDAAAEGASAEQQKVSWKIAPDNVGMGIGGAEIPASEFQATNPIYILLFGLLFSALWGWLAARKWEPSTPVKFALGLLQLGLGFAALWYGVKTADTRGMVGISWVLLAYLLHTTGELCLSPVGLSMVTKLSPARMVSTVMGAWFLATAFSNFLAAIIAAFTGVSHGESGQQVIPPPIESLNVYGDVFGKIGMTAVGSAVICFILAPWLSKWMHTDAPDEEEAPSSADSEAAESA